MLSLKLIKEKWGISSKSSSVMNRYRLVLIDEKLQLRKNGDEKFGSVTVDFCSNKLKHRRKYGGNKQEALAKAVGVKKKTLPTVLDATAGFGRDAFILASLGCRVHMIERSRVVAALLDDGIKRACEDNEIGAWVKSRLSLSCQDSCQGFSALPFNPDVVYLDPMFPEKRKTALVKKEMQALQSLIGPDIDADCLLDIALKTALVRVAVKRPLAAGYLAGQKPQAVIKSGHYRFDLYLKH